MRARRLHDALAQLSAAISEAEAAINELKAEHDPLALHVFSARRDYRKMTDTKSGKRHERAALLSYQEARVLGFEGGLSEWRRLLDAPLLR